jgi:hypothetical protein
VMSIKPVTDITAFFAPVQVKGASKNAF